MSSTGMTPLSMSTMRILEVTENRPPCLNIDSLCMYPRFSERERPCLSRLIQLVVPHLVADVSS